MTHPYLASPTPLALAHRGGARENPENSLRAFRHAVDLGFTYIETDVRATADGVPVVFHDERLNRVTDRVGRVRDLPFDEVKKAQVGDAERIHSLAEILEILPETRFNIDIKEDNAVGPTLDVLADHLDRVCVAAFSWRRLRTVRAAFGDRVCTSLAPQEVAALVSRARFGRLSVASQFAFPEGPIAVQVPRRSGRVPIITPAFVAAAAERGWPVHAWTIDDPDVMDLLLDMGVQGIVTDRPSVLKHVMSGRAKRNVRAVSDAHPGLAPEG
jgi:glycerophosphoryl diester phosphodiesterase